MSEIVWRGLPGLCSLWLPTAVFKACLTPYGVAAVIEKVLYNGLLAGWFVAGDWFFYDNPLESDGKHRRPPWLGCACCRSNWTASYATGPDRVYVNPFVRSDARATVATNRGTQRGGQGFPGTGASRCNARPTTCRRSIAIGGPRGRGASGAIWCARGRGRREIRWPWSFP